MNIVITGGSRGIGAEAVRFFATQGHRVRFLYEKNHEAAQAVAAQSGAEAVCCDVADKDAVDTALRGFGPVDVLINNAGIALTKALAKELGPSGIRVNCIAPGVVLTDMCASVDPETMDWLKKETPVGRHGLPADMVQAMDYLVRAQFVTGQILPVNGGMVI